MNIDQTNEFSGASDKPYSLPPAYPSNLADLTQMAPAYATAATLARIEVLLISLLREMASDRASVVNVVGKKSSGKGGIK